MFRRHLVYLRCSTTKQETESQRTALTARVALYEEPVEWLEDNATGGNTDRADYQKMLSIVNAGWAIDITCWRADRIGRNALENLKLAEACKARSCDIIGHSDGLRLLSPNGQMIFTILSAIAEYEREKISENTKAGMILAKEKGKIIGGSFHGYTKQHVLDALPTIKLLKASGYSVLKISEQLKINRKSIHRVLEMMEQGIPIRSRSEMLKEVPLERRGKAYHKSLEMAG